MASSHMTQLALELNVNAMRLWPSGSSHCVNLKFLVFNTDWNLKIRSEQISQMKQLCLMIANEVSSESA